MYFTEVSWDIHGPFEFATDEGVEQIQQYLETHTFRSRCIHEETNDWLAHEEIFTCGGKLLDLCDTLEDYPVGDRDILPVILVPDEATSPDEAARDMEEVD